MADANLTALRYVAESTFAVTPAAPAFRELRYTSSSLAYTPQTEVSEEIRSDRQVTDLILVGFQTAGDIQTELSHDNLVDIIEGGMFSAWVQTTEKVNAAAATQITSVTTDGTTTTVNVNSGGTAFVAGRLIAGGMFGVAGLDTFIGVVASNSGTTVVITGAGGASAAPPVSSFIKVVGVRGASADITATGTGLGSTALDFTTLGLTVGQWIKIGGTATANKFATAANNGFARIRAIAASALTLDSLPVGWSTDSGTGKLIDIWFGDFIKNGTTERSYTIEMQYDGTTPTTYEYYAGSEISTLNFQMDSQAILTSTVGIMGSVATSGTSRFASATTLPAPTEDVMNSSSDVGQFRENGVIVSGPNFIMNASVAIDNTLRMQNAIGSVAAVGIGVGRFQVTGVLNTYFGDTNLLDKVRNNTASSVDFIVKKNGRAYVIDIPRIKFESGSPTVQGIDTDIMIELNYRGLRHPSLGYTMSMSSFYYYAA